jgi:hypothetical protein
MYEDTLEVYSVEQLRRRDVGFVVVSSMEKDRITYTAEVVMGVWV